MCAILCLPQYLSSIISNYSIPYEIGNEYEQKEEIQRRISEFQKEFSNRADKLQQNNSVKGYRERFDEITKEYKEYEKNSKCDYFTMMKADEATKKFASIQVMPNKDVQEKLQKLWKKRYW